MLTVTFRDGSGSLFFLKANGVRRLLVSELRETNIVDEVSVWSSDSLTENYVDALAQLLFGEQEANHESFQKILKDEINRIHQGVQVFVEFDAVYGARLYLLAESVDVVD